jgi:hypothetical protein
MVGHHSLGTLVIEHVPTIRGSPEKLKWFNLFVRVFRALSFAPRTTTASVPEQRAPAGVRLGLPAVS